jgi:hypothetical protein
LKDEWIFSVVQQAQPFAAMGAEVVKSSAVLLSKFVLG